jgi:hypothetical protein
MNAELECGRKGFGLFQGIVSRHSPGGAEKTTTNRVMIVGFLAEILTWPLLKMPLAL